MANEESLVRCAWAVKGSELEKNYHDHEWGVPVHDDAKFFEMLLLESMQAGLSWSIILNKREAFRKAFDQFDPQKIVLYDQAKIDELLKDKGIVRNKLKIKAAINNAGVFLDLQKQYGSFDAFIWSYVNNQPIVAVRSQINDVPATTELSDNISKDLKKRGFKFLGSTTVYAFMQATGLVNDHIVGCFKAVQSAGISESE